MLKFWIVLNWIKIKWGKKFRNRTDLQKHQQKKLTHFAQNTLSKSPFYSRFFVDRIFQWNNTPVMEKDLFMEQFDQINTVGISLQKAMDCALEAERSRNFKSELNGVTVGLSTGTSGKRGLFLVSPRERALWVALVMNRVIKPRLFKKQKIAFFLRANSNLYSSVQSSLFEFNYFDIFKRIDELETEVAIFNPEILAAQPSVLMSLTKAQQAGRIALKVHQVISFAEVLQDEDRLLIEKTFGCKITEVYQCTEGFLGASCDHGTIHLNEDYILIEEDPIDENRFHPIVTDFSRHTQPVIKYRLNDILVKRKMPCPCGSVLTGIEKIIGRDDDVLLGTSSDGIEKSLYPDLIARRIALHTDNFSAYHIRQTSMNDVDVYLNCPDAQRQETQAAFQLALHELCREQGIQNFNIQFHTLLEIPAGAKNRKIIRMF